MRKVLVACCICSLIVAASNYVLVDRFNKEIKKLELEVNSLYFLSAMQGRQIQTLQNYELRRESPMIQEKLKLIKAQYADNNHEK